MEQYILHSVDLLLPVSERYSQIIQEKYPFCKGKTAYLHNSVEKINLEHGEVQREKGRIIAVGGDRKLKNNITVAKATLLQNGAVVASVISEFVTNAIQFVYMKKKVKFNVNWKSLITGIFSTAVMSVCVLGLMLLKLPNTIGLIVEVGCGALVYIAINLMMKNALMFEMIQKVKTKLLHKA